MYAFMPGMLPAIGIAALLAKLLAQDGSPALYCSFSFVQQQGKQHIMQEPRHITKHEKAHQNAISKRSLMPIQNRAMHALYFMRWSSDASMKVCMVVFKASLRYNLIPWMTLTQMKTLKTS